MVFDKIFCLLWTIFQYWANFHCCKWPNREQIIYPHWTKVTNFIHFESRRNRWNRTLPDFGFFLFLTGGQCWKTLLYMIVSFIIKSLVKRLRWNQNNSVAVESDESTIISHVIFSLCQEDICPKLLTTFKFNIFMSMS